MTDFIDNCKYKKYDEEEVTNYCMLTSNPCNRVYNSEIWACDIRIAQETRKAPIYSNKFKKLYSYYCNNCNKAFYSEREYAAAWMSFDDFKCIHCNAPEEYIDSVFFYWFLDILSGERKARIINEIPNCIIKKR